MISLDRFKAPCLADEYENCANCQERVHYEFLDEDGFCQNCQPERNEDEDDTN